MDRPDFDLQAFYRGERALLAAVYREHYGRVERSVLRYCHGIDADTVIHEVFLALVERQQMRRRFTGGDLGAWLAKVARNRAIDHLRKLKREVLVGVPLTDSEAGSIEEWSKVMRQQEVAFVRQGIVAFAKDVLPQLSESMQNTFQLLFVKQLTVAEAALELRARRTTISSRQGRLLELLGPFLRKRFEEQQR